MFNHTLHSDLVLRPNFLPGGDQADLVVSVDTGRGRAADSFGRDAGIPPVELNYSKPSRLEFRLYPDTILCTPYSSTNIELEIAFLGQVMAVWMETRDIMMFHAGAVAIDGQTVGFMGYNGAGKSTLTTMFVADGAPLVTDDLLAVVRDKDGYQAWPSYPSMRMWPTTARMIGLDYESMERVHPALEKRFVPIGPDRFGNFRDHPSPLRRLYILGERLQGYKARIEPISIGEATYELARHTFAQRKLHAMGVTAQRFDALTTLASTNHIRRMSIPEGLDKFQGIKAGILADLASDCGK